MLLDVRQSRRRLREDRTFANLMPVCKACGTLRILLLAWRVAAEALWRISTWTMHNGSHYASTCTPSTIHPHTSDQYFCSHCDTSHDDSAHPGLLTTHDVMVDDSITHDGAFTSPTVLEDSSTNDSATHSLVVASVSDQYLVLVYDY